MDGSDLVALDWY